MAVVEVPLDHVLLNHRSHRIRSELESLPDRDVIARDPQSEEAQALLSAILAATPGFEDLRANLREEGQRDAGVVTADGVLINANTRCVALRQLTEEGARPVEYISLAVLPADAGPKEIDDVELKLQMQRDLRQDYTLTNELLFVQDLIQGYGQSSDQVARSLGWATSSETMELAKGRRRIEQSLRVLGLIRDLQALSGDSRRLTEFDDKRQALQEIDEAYEDLLQNDPEGAERLKTARFIALLAQLGYREMREIDQSFVEDYVQPHLSEDEHLGRFTERLLTPVEASDVDLPGIDLLADDEWEHPENSSLDGGTLLGLLARVPGERRIELPAPNGAVVTLDKDGFTNRVRNVFDLATQDAKDDRLKSNKLDRPVALLKEADQKVRRARDAYTRVASSSGFSRPQFDYQLRQNTKHLKELKEAFEADGT